MIDADQNKHGDLTDQIIFTLVKKGFSPETKDGYGAHFPRAIPASAAAKDLISKLLTLDTAKRYTAMEALEHPWLKGTGASETAIAVEVLNNLKTFSGTNKFKAAVLNVMTDYVGPEEVRQLQTAFRAMDENKDGKISVSELKKAMAKPGGTELKGINEEDLLKLMTIADVDGDGALSYEELFNTVLSRKLAAKEERLAYPSLVASFSLHCYCCCFNRLWEAFSKFDLNGDGRVSLDEISRALGDPAKARELIAEVDADGDGYVVAVS
jgi:calcium-dependent protein kinase